MFFGFVFLFCFVFFVFLFVFFCCFFVVVVCCCCFLAKYLRFTVWKIGRDGVKRCKGSLASGKTLVSPILSQNLIHTDIELG